MPVSGTKAEKESGNRDDNEAGEEEKTKVKYGVLIKEHAKSIWAPYSAIKTGGKREGGSGSEKYYYL